MAYFKIQLCCTLEPVLRYNFVVPVYNFVVGEYNFVVPIINIIEYILFIIINKEE